MKVQTVKIKEFKILSDFEKEVSGNHILVMGDNGVGKSSFIQFIEIALGKQSHLPPGIKGAGELTVDKDGQRITFKVDFRDGKPYLKVTGKGISIDNKKGAIAELVGALDFDIDEFTNLSKSKSGRAEQVKIFKSFLPIETQTELAKFEADVKNHSEERTELGKDVKKLEGVIALHPLRNLMDADLKKIAKTDTAEAMATLNKIREENAKIEKVQSGLFERKQKIADKNTRIAELQAEINKLNGEIEVLDKEHKDGQKWLDAHKVTDTSAIEKTIQDAAEQNEKYNQAQSILSDREKLEVLKNEYGELTALIESSREAIANAIREQDSPVDGLTYDDEQLIYNGIPVNPDSLSSSEIIELGIKLKMAENPDLGILFIQRAESLGSERFKMIKDIADKAGWQIIAEQVERGIEKLHIEIMSEELITT